MATGESAAAQKFSTLIDGVDKLDSGATAVAQGAGTLRDGITKLDSGATTLADGSAKLADGTGKVAMVPPPSITEQPNWPTALANSKTVPETCTTAHSSLPMAKKKP